jgi:hypothetical protein
LFTGLEWLASDGLYYPTTFEANRKYTLLFQQSAVLTSVSNGLAFLMYSGRLNFAGFGTVWLPQKFNGALCDYVASNVHINVVSHGTIPVYSKVVGADHFGTAPTAVVRTTLDGTGFVVEALDSQPQCFSVTIFGAQQVVP